MASSPHTQAWTTQQAAQAAQEDSTAVALPLQVAPPTPTPHPCNQDGRRYLTHITFATSDLYNWEMQNPKFSEKPSALLDLLDSVMITHQPTWDDRE